MSARVEVCLLGPMQVRCDGAIVEIPPGKQRALLAALLLQRGRSVPADQLAEMLWEPEPPPPSALLSLRNYVSRLRRALEPLGLRLILTRPGGYLINGEDCELDLARMERELDAARLAARDGDWREAARHAAASLALWRGEPLSDVDLPRLTALEVPRLTEMRLQAHELRIEAYLALARHAEIVMELPQLIDANPLCERLYALQMLALYRSGRRAEALRAYAAARDLLAEEIGGDPGPELQALHLQILHDDPALAAPPVPGTGSGPSGRPASASRTREVPHQLPGAVGYFTGRTGELAALTGLLAGRPGVRAPALVISAIGGTAGVGKTALAVQWAHQVAGQFPDGQLYVNLRGFDPDQPVPPADALAGFLRDLGVPGTDIPDGVDERARLYRSRLAGRRMLVVLDNVRDADQVRPLLPGDPGCVAVVSSRDALAGLVAADGARRLDLDALPLADAVALLGSLIGPRADEDPRSVAELARLCACLPLALRIAAELAAARKGAPLAGLVAELAADRLGALDAGEDRTDVRAVFSWSVRQLDEDAALAFALAGLHPGGDLDVFALAALIGTTAGQARRVLAMLTRASLVQETAAGRYGMHDLLRAYAREQAAARDADGRCQRALTALFDYYLAAAAAAMDVLFPAEAHLRPRTAAADLPDMAADLPDMAADLPDMAGEAGARAWLAAERANLVAVVVHCAGHGWRGHAAGLAGALFRYLMTGSHLAEADTVYAHALQAARESGDIAAEAEALNGLGGIGIMKGHFIDAAGHYQAALERYRQCGDQPGQARVLNNLGYTESQLGNFQSAAGYFGQSIAVYQDAGNSLGAARAQADLAGAQTELGSYEQASEQLQLALPVLRQAKDQVYEARALSKLGWLYFHRGQLTEAADFLELALALFRRIDNPAGVAADLCNLGEVTMRQGELARAISYLRQSATLFREIGNQHGEVVTLRTLARALHEAGQPADARAELETAIRLAAETGNSYEQAGAHRDLAESYHRDGQDLQARHHWQRALALYTQLGAPEADEIRPC